MFRKFVGAFLGALMLFGIAAAVAAPAGADPAQSSPIFECAWPNPFIKGHYVTVWGYNNPGKTPETFDIGEHNRFLPQPYDRHQPTTFLPGRHDNVAITDWDGKEELKWKVGSTTVKAAATPVCNNNPVPITGGGLSAIVAVIVVAAIALALSVFFGRRWHRGDPTSA